MKEHAMGKLKFATTTIATNGWMIDMSDPQASRNSRLAGIERLGRVYRLPAVEMTLDLALLYPQVFDADFYHRVADLQQQQGFACSVHLPFLWLDLASLNESIRKASVESILKTLELIRPVEVQACVLHLWGGVTQLIGSVTENSQQMQAVYAVLARQAQRSLEEIVEHYDAHKLCVETLERPDFSFALPIIEYLDASICLDVGHLAWQGGGELAFLEKHWPRIRVIHLHDVSIREQAGQKRILDHLPLGKGQLDYKAFLERLEQKGFDGIVVLELNHRPDLEASLEKVRSFL
jgi:sugar phosphate isomerase/epimerase